MATTLAKLHLVGYSWPEIIQRITTVPAKNFRLQTKGQLKTGFDGDLTIFEIHNEEQELVDSNGYKRTTHEVIQPVKTIIGGVVYDN